jgi:hypothetical protein
MTAVMTFVYSHPARIASSIDSCSGISTYLAEQMPVLVSHRAGRGRDVDILQLGRRHLELRRARCHFGAISILEQNTDSSVS